MGKIILTGDRPTGRLHVGHYVGSLKRRLELQNSGAFDEICLLYTSSLFILLFCCLFGGNTERSKRIRKNIMTWKLYISMSQGSVI